TRHGCSEALPLTAPPLDPHWRILSRAGRLYTAASHLHRPKPQLLAFSGMCGQECLVRRSRGAIISSPLFVMGVDPVLHDGFPHVFIHGEKYYYGKDPEFGQYMAS